MKALTICFLCLVTSYPAFARWADRAVAGPKGLEYNFHSHYTYEKPTVELLKNGDYKITIQANPKSALLRKALYIVKTDHRKIGRDRLLTGIDGWALYEKAVTQFQKIPPLPKDADEQAKAFLEKSEKESMARLNERRDGVNDVSPLLADKSQKNLISFIVPKAGWDRVYLFYGFKPATLVTDGGERIIYDLPAFIEAARE